MARYYLALATVLLLAACSAPQKIVKERYVWPPPPDVARIEWLKSYKSQLDFDKTPSQLFWTGITGEDAPRSLSKPVEVKSVPELNKFLVSDLNMSAVVIFDLAVPEQRTLKIPDGIPPLYIPLSIALGNDGSIYVLERRSASVYLFDKFEKFKKIVSLKSASVKNPTSMLIDSKNSLMYVSDATSKKIAVTDLSGTFIRRIGDAAEADGRFNLPIAMALNSKGHLIVADAFDSKIQIFDGTGRFLSKFGKRGDAAGDFQLIKSVAVDSSDNIYVVDGRNHNISIFSERGELLLVMGGYYASAETGKLAPGGFSIPVGIDIDSTDTIYVVDQMNSRVQVFKYFSEEYLRLNSPL